MYKTLFYLLLSATLFSCNGNENDAESAKTEKPEDLVVIENDLFTEYYPGKKQIKFQGMQDESKKRHGKWVFYSETGKELSITHYSHGAKEGHTIVKYPNGNLRYVGEYSNDLEVGIWIYYDEKGKKTEKDYDAINR